MGQCPECGALLVSTREMAAATNRTDRCIRLQLRTGQLAGVRFGGTWVIPKQSAGVLSHAGPLACPQCAEPWYSAEQAAAALEVPVSTLYLLLKQRAGFLRAFRVGRRWVIPESGVKRYRAVIGALETADGTTIDRILEALDQQVEVLVRPEVCHCPAYPFPHRKGGGRCTGDLRSPSTSS